jgi:hypothetical protein
LKAAVLCVERKWLDFVNSTVVTREQITDVNCAEFAAIYWDHINTLGSDARIPTLRLVRRNHNTKFAFVKMSVGKNALDPYRYFTEHLGIVIPGNRKLTGKSGRTSALSALVNDSNLKWETISKQSKHKDPRSLLTYVAPSLKTQSKVVEELSEQIALQFDHGDENVNPSLLLASSSPPKMNHNFDHGNHNLNDLLLPPSLPSQPPMDFNWLGNENLNTLLQPPTLPSPPPIINFKFDHGNGNLDAHLQLPPSPPPMNFNFENDSAAGILSSSLTKMSLQAQGEESGSGFLGNGNRPDDDENWSAFEASFMRYREFRRYQHLESVCGPPTQFR